MRVTTFLLVAALSVFLGSGIAAAEKVRTNQSTKLYARPGEQAKVLKTVKSGQNMTLISKDGRWLKVRVLGRTGYVPRSKVDMADDGGISRNTRRRPFVDGRSKKRGFGGSAPDDRVGADALGEGADEGEEEEEEEEDEPAPKKTATKKPPPKVEEEEEEEEEDEPAPKKTPAKAVAKATTKPAAKGGDDEEEEDDEGGDGEEDDESGDEPAPKKTAAREDDEDEDDEEEARATTRVSKKVMLYADPDETSDEEIVVRPEDVLYPIETKGGWTFVENAEGDGGWVQNDLLDSGEGSVGGGKRAIDVRARLGFSILQQGMRTTGSTVLEPPDNYNINTPAITLSIGAGILKPQGKKLLVGGEFTYDHARALGGVKYDPDKMGPLPEKTIGITLHNVNVRAMVGLDFKKKSGMALLGRLGYRYQGYLIPNGTNLTDNPAKIPSEVVKGPTLGAALNLPRLTNKLGVRFALDAMLFAASVKQTVGIEDGANPSLKAISLGVGLSYKFKKTFDLAAAYDLNYMGIDFGAPLASSMRGHMGTNVARTDIFHMVTFGIAKPF